jgi:drug/metabolite transporter (DMT)-like permease
MQTRPIGIVFIIIGILMMVYTGFSYVTTQKVVDIGPVQISKEKNNPVQWSPIVGVVLLVGGVFMLGRGKKV